MDEVAAQAREMATSDISMAVGVTPGPPRDSGRFMAITPSPARPGTWRVAENASSSMAWATGARVSSAKRATASAMAWSSSVLPSLRKFISFARKVKKE